MTHSVHETTIPAEVRDFVADVREHLADLDSEEQQELTAGLEADLADLVAEHGTGALGDPATYARELRSAAGHDPEMGRRAPRRSLRRAAMEAMDGMHDSWDRVLDSVPGDLRGFLTALRPTWWVVRAVTAWLVVQDIRGPYIVLGHEWLVVLAVFLVVSVQLGRRAWGIDRLLAASVLARLLLVALNVFAVTMVPGAADRLAWHVAEQRAYQFAETPTTGSGPGDRFPDITFRGRQVCELEVRDARDRVVDGAYLRDLDAQRRVPLSAQIC